MSYRNTNTYYDNTMIDGSDRMWTIWDGGGNDTFDISAVPNLTTTSTIDLRGGLDAAGKVRFSSVGAELIAIALDPTPVIAGDDTTRWTKPIEIENAIGATLTSNVIYGNDAHNEIFGGEVKDTVYGGIGNDTVYGGSGSDTLIGGAGSDVIYGGDGSGVLGNVLIGGNATVSASGVVSGVTDDLVKDVIYSELTNVYATDTIYVGKYDELHVKSTKTKIITLAGAVVSGGSGADTISGDGGVIAGGDGLDSITGGTAADWLSGGTMFNWDDGVRDTLKGGDGGDIIYAGKTDVANGDAGNDTMYGGEGKSTLYGGAGDDLIKGETLAGSSTFGGDAINGEGGNDTIYGMDGDDNLSGGRAATTAANDNYTLWRKYA